MLEMEAWMRSRSGGVIALFVVLASCSSRTAEGYSCSGLQTTFFRMPLAEQVAAFGRYPLDDQYVIYVCGNQRLEPPALYLREPYAREGKVAADFLATKLATVTYDFTAYNIIEVFEKMQQLGSYDVAGDAELLSLLTSSVARMKEADEKRKATELLTSIQTRSR